MMGEVEVRNLKSKYGMTERCPEGVSHVTMPGTRAAQILLAKRTQVGAARPTASCPPGDMKHHTTGQTGKGQWQDERPGPQTKPESTEKVPSRSMATRGPSWAVSGRLELG